MSLCPRRLPKSSVAALVMGALLLGAAGCGYRTGLAPSAPSRGLSGADALPEGLSPEEAAARLSPATEDSIGIQIFGNESMLPNLERELHAAFTRAARRHVAMRLTAPSRADLYVRGKIKNFRRGGGARLGNNRVVETQEVVTVEAELVDGATGQVLGRATSSPRIGTAIDVPGRELAQRDRVLANAADRLLLLLLAGLEYGVTRPGDPLLPGRAPRPHPRGVGRIGISSLLGPGRVPPVSDHRNLRPRARRIASA